MTSPSPKQLIVGVGSAHGDDQAGWQLVDTLKARSGVSAQLRKARVPHDMIDWFDGCETLHVVDACDRQTSLLRMDISTGHIPAAIETRSSTSHQISVAAVVELADSLDLLPQRVMLWAIPGESFDPDGQVGDRCRRQIERCADLIERELDHA
jgi:hydrogenase maturation protease